MLVSDPEGAVEWLFKLPEDIAINGDAYAVRHFAQEGPEAAVEFINRLSESGQEARVDSAVREFARAYGKAQPRDAVEWALSIPPDFGPSRIEAIASSFAGLAKVDPDLAMQQAGERIEDQETLQIVRETIRVISGTSSE